MDFNSFNILTILIVGLGGFLFWLIRMDFFAAEKSWNFGLVDKIITYTKKFDLDLDLNDLKTISVILMIPFFNLIYFVFILSIMIVLFVHKWVKGL